MPPTTTYVEPGLQAGAWQHPPITPSTQPGMPPHPQGPYQQQPQRVVVVVNAPNFGK